MNVHRQVKSLLAVVIVTLHDDDDVITPDINNYAWLLSIDHYNNAFIGRAPEAK